MPPGGGLAAANYLDNDNVDADGTVIAAIQNTVPFELFLSNGQVQFDPAEMNWRHADNRDRAPYHLAHCEDRKSARCAKPQLCSGDTIGTEIVHAYATPGAVKKRLTEIYQLGQGAAR